MPSDQFQQQQGLPMIRYYGFILIIAVSCLCACQRLHTISTPGSESNGKNAKWIKIDDRNYVKHEELYDGRRDYEMRSGPITIIQRLSNDGSTIVILKGMGHIYKEIHFSPEGAMVREDIYPPSTPRSGTWIKYDIDGREIARGEIALHSN